jgi:PTH2 family peptidyl-tRNA hydrolase
VSTKQVIIIRKDLKMRRGKEIAQGAHAAIAFLTRKLDPTAGKELELLPISSVVKEWLSSSFKKVTLQVDSERELMEIASAARKAGVECHVITDSGATEFGGVPTKTCLALGPDTDERIDPLTGHLKLY